MQPPFLGPKDQPVQGDDISEHSDRGLGPSGDPARDEATRAVPAVGADAAAASDATQAVPVGDATQAVPVGDATQAIPAASRQDDASATGWLIGGRYRVGRRLGAGAMAEVFQARDEMLQRDVAVKVFRAHAEDGDSLGGAHRQEVELQALAGLNHPNLITLFDGSVSGENGSGQAYLVMELIDGPTLSARLAEGPLTEPEARLIGTQIADALAYVHSRSMVHRDIKPANILIGSDTTTGDLALRARLSDFGIVRLIGSERMTSLDLTVGTATYIAPEQARGGDVGPEADIYALGLLLIESLTGVKSFDGPPIEAMIARLNRSPEVPADLPQPWPGLLRAMTATDPAQRPTAAQVAATLRGTGGSGYLPAAGVVPPYSAASDATRIVGAAAAGGVAAAFGAAGAYSEAYPTAMTTQIPAGYDTGAPADGYGRDTGLSRAEMAAEERGERRRRNALIAVALIALLAVVVGGYLLFRPSSGGSGTLTPPSSTPAPTTSAAPTTTAPTTTAPSTTTAPTTTPATTPPTTTPPPTTAPPTTTPPPTTAPTTTAPPTTTPPPTTTAPPTTAATSASPSAAASTT